MSWTRLAGSSLLFFASLALASCSSDSGADNPDEAVFRVEACGDESFRILLRDPELIAQAEAEIGAETPKIVNGALVAGDGGFNAPWSWHLDPASIEFAELTIELCDGCPHMVEEDLDQWIDVVGRFCSWSSRVVEVKAKIYY